MSISGSKITGLNTSKANFLLSEDSCEVEGWMSIKTIEKGAKGGVEEGGWSEELVRSCIEGWWWGERTGSTVTRVSLYISRYLNHMPIRTILTQPILQFSMTSLTPPAPQSNLLVRLHLSSFSKELLSDEAERITKDGWIEVEVPGWKLSEATTMEARNVLQV